MKLLFDQNLSYKLIDQLEDYFPHSAHVRNIKLHTATDETVWEYAKKHGFVIVSQDSDFNDILIKSGLPPQIIWIRAGNVRTNHIKNLLIAHHKELNAFVKQHILGCYTLYDELNQ